MKEKIEQIIDRNTEGNYLLSSTDKAQMVSEILDLVGVTDSLPLQTKLEMFYDFLYERGIAKQLGIGIDTIVKHFIDEKLSDNDR